MIIVLSNQISAWLWSPVCFYVMQIISYSLLLYYITLSVIFSLEVFLSAQTVGTLCYSQQSHYKVKTCRQVWFLKTKPLCNDAFCKHIYQTAWPLDYFTVSMRLCLFPTSGTMSQPVLVCMQEASEYICISLKGDNEEMLQNQHVCGLTTSMCTCLSTWKSDTVVVCCQTGWLKNMCTFWNLPFIWCSAVTLELSMKHVKERSSQKLWLITDWLMNWVFICKVANI